MGQRVDIADLAGIMEIGAEFGVTSAAVCQWSTRYDDFPQPITKIGVSRIWLLSEVKRWRKSRGW